MNEPNGNPIGRRDFLQLCFGWGATLLALGASVAAAARYMVPNVLYEADRRYKALRPEDYADGTTFLPDLRVFVLRRGNTFRAVSAVCTHLGCTVNRAADGTGFHCPCHGSVFDNNGKVTGGPAPRPLTWYLVSLSRDGHLMIDASQPVQPDKVLLA